MLISHIEIDQVQSVTAKANYQNGSGYADIRIYMDGRIVEYNDKAEWELDSGTLEEVKRFIDLELLFPALAMERILDRNVL